MTNPWNVLLSLALLALALSGCGPESHPALDYSVQGIDVSRHQGEVDWMAAAAEGLDFAFVKATEGGDFRDEYFAPNWRALGRTNIRRGAYHFFRPEVPAEIQARNFFAQVSELAVGDLPPVLDVELRGMESNAAFIVGLHTWLKLAEIRYGVKPILYTGQKFYNKYLAGQFNDYPIWIARYHDETPSLADGRSFQFWQYNDQGRSSGVWGPVDVNVFAGTYLQLLQLCVPAPGEDQQASTWPPSP